MGKRLIANSANMVTPPEPAGMDPLEQSGETVRSEPLETLLHRPLRDVEAVEEGVQPAPLAALAANAVAVGRVVALETEGLRVYLPGLEFEGTARALCTVPEDWAERECAVLFENGDPARPLVVGWMLPAPALVEATAPQTAQAEREVLVDGERLVIRADTELELRCGESVILLQRDGRIEIRGNSISSQATATNRLRGGSIHMN